MRGALAVLLMVVVGVVGVGLLGVGCSPGGDSSARSVVIGGGVGVEDVGGLVDGEEPVARVRLVGGADVVVVGEGGEGGTVRVRAVHVPGWEVEAALPVRFEMRGGGWWIGEEGGGTVARLWRGGGGSGRDALVVERVRRGEGMDRGLIASGFSSALAVDARGGGGRWSGGVEGAVWLHGRADGGMDAVARVPMERYLTGVVKRELYRGWRLETYKAQAVAARSYALHEIGRARSSGRHFDLESTTADQVFGGAGAHETAERGVRETEGEVLTWDGAVVRAYYSSDSGGRSASAATTWGVSGGRGWNAVPPLAGASPDDSGRFSPRWRWEVRRDAEELARRIRAFGAERGYLVRELDELRRIEVLEANAFGRPERYRVVGRGGRWWELSAEDLRLAMNWSSGDGLDEVSRSERVWSGDVEVEVRRGRVLIRGRGFGHGVGMSQFGAEGMARAGLGYREILRRSYPGAQIEAVY